MIKLNIQNNSDFKFNFEKIYNEIIAETLKLLEIEGDTELSVIILDDINMRKISKKYRNIDTTTDILSFPTNYREIRKLIGYNLLGDIYLSFEKLELQAKKFGHSSKREWSYLFTHGLLHLLGYDHISDDEEKKMNAIAYKIMEKVKVSRDA
ncbi:MAG: rRNA maturation RNase YbeY [Mycoplasmatales bacterium]|nr:rRNA maturation RNase YbeY [Mycoplasmatales bacterium]